MLLFGCRWGRQFCLPVRVAQLPCSVFPSLRSWVTESSFDRHNPVAAHMSILGPPMRWG
jgi:hypothetical protein